MVMINSNAPALSLAATGFEDFSNWNLRMDRYEYCL